MITKRKRPPRRSAPLIAPTYSSPLALLALGLFGGYAALVLMPEAGFAIARWKIALAATGIAGLGALWALRNCLPLAATPMRGRAVATVTLLASLAAGWLTYDMHGVETGARGSSLMASFLPDVPKSDAPRDLTE